MADKFQIRGVIPPVVIPDTPDHRLAVHPRRVCERPFAYRKAQTWPPEVVLRDGWEGLYAEQAPGLPVLQNLADAVEWANGFIRLIAVAG